MLLGAWVRISRDRRGWEQGKYFYFLKMHPAPALATRRLFTKRRGKASVVWVSSLGQMGTGYPAQYASVIIFQRLIRGVGGAQEVQTLPQAVTPAFWWCPSLSLALGRLYYELSTPALWWDTEAGLGHQGQDQDNRHRLDQGRGCPPSLLGVCCLPAIGRCVEMPMNTSGHPNVHTFRKLTS